MLQAGTRRSGPGLLQRRDDLFAQVNCGSNAFEQAILAMAAGCLRAQLLELYGRPRARALSAGNLSQTQWPAEAMHRGPLPGRRRLGNNCESTVACKIEEGRLGQLHCLVPTRSAAVGAAAIARCGYHSYT